MIRKEGKMLIRGHRKNCHVYTITKELDQFFTIGACSIEEYNFLLARFKEKGASCQFKEKGASVDETIFTTPSLHEYGIDQCCYRFWSDHCSEAIIAEMKKEGYVAIRSTRSGCYILG